MNDVMKMMHDLAVALEESNMKNDKLLTLVETWIESAETLKDVNPSAWEVYMTCAKDVAQIFGSES